MAKINTTSGKLYILRERDYLTQELHPYVKIGIVRGEKETSSRIAEHQTGNPREIIEVQSLDAPLVEPLETHLHYMFGDRWVTGEWFLMDDDKVKEVIKLASCIRLEQQALMPYLNTISDFENVLSKEELLTAEEDHIKLHQALLEEDKNCKIISAHIKILETALLKKMDGFSGIEGIVELRGNVIKSVLDKKYIKENFPAEYNAFCKDTLKFSGSFNPKGLITLSKIDKELDTALKGLNSPKFTAADTQLPLMHKSAELEQLHLQLIMLNKEMQEAEWKKLQWQTRLQAAVGDYAGIEGLCTWERKNKTSVEFDEKGFLRQYPQMEQYKTEAKESVAVIFRPYRAYPFQVNLT